MRLEAGTQAPTFTGETQKGEPISLESYRGKNVYLKFFRYAGCPNCNLRVHEYYETGKELSDAGITTLMVFHSPKEILDKNLKAENSFTVIADPEKKLFNLYQVEKSWVRIAIPAMYVDYTKAIFKGFFSPKLFGNEGGDVGLPADFFIDGTGKLRHVHYGKHAGDSLRVHDSVKIFRELGLAGNTN